MVLCYDLSMLEAIKKLLPKTVLKKIRPIYHGLLAHAAAVAYGHPSRKMRVIGLTGTAGKSTTVQILAALLNANGHKTGYTTTAGHFDGKVQHRNLSGLSMPGRFELQYYLYSMLNNGCEYAIVEATSEGLEQNRHLGIDFDGCAITNLDEAHLESHGSFEKYKHAKGRLFRALEKSQKKNKFLGANFDSLDPEYFLSFKADRKFALTFQGAEFEGQVFEGKFEEQPGKFLLNGLEFETQLPGRFNILNAAMAMAIANMAGLSLEDCAKALREFQGIVGRMEKIENSRGLQIYIDYSPEPFDLKNSLEALAALPHQRLVHIFGSTGGHRDKAKRFEFGKISAQIADKIIITNDDVYESDEQEIADNILEGINKVAAKNRKVKEVQTVLDRETAIKQAINEAEEGDLLVFTGKGSEQFLVLPGNQRIDWDERGIVEEALRAK